MLLELFKTQIMKINIKELRRSVAVRIIAGLMMANLVAFTLANLYIERDKTSDNKPKVENKSILETGWQVMHWSYSLLEFFKNNPGA